MVKIEKADGVFFGGLIGLFYIYISTKSGGLFLSLLDFEKWELILSWIHR